MRRRLPGRPADGDGRAADVEAALGRLLKRTAGNDLFAHDQTPTIRTSADNRVHTVQVGTPHSPKSDGARDSLELLRDWVPQAMEGVPGAESAVGGKVAQGLDFTGHLEDRMPWVVGFVLLLTFVTMVLIFRSLAVALSAILLNLLSAAASFGVLVAVFQHTWAEGLLDFHSSGAVVSWLPLFLFVVLFGLSMDYYVFVVSRIRETAQNGATVKDAVREGITRSAGVVTSAAIVMVGVFSIFGTLSMVEFKQLGVGLAAATSTPRAPTTPASCARSRPPSRTTRERSISSRTWTGRTTPGSRVVPPSAPRTSSSNRSTATTDLTPGSSGRKQVPPRRREGSLYILRRAPSLLR
ncbi:MMPL family transporter [Streptomyces viridosporus]